VTTQGVTWASEEVSDLVTPPLNLVLYIHLRIFTYTSNVLIASFEYMELMLDSSTLKNLMFLPEVSFVYRPYTDFLYLPTLVLYHRTYSTPEGDVLVLGCTLGPDEAPFANVTHVFMLTSYTLFTSEYEDTHILLYHS
jgi:hypothetical protein